MAAQFPFDSLPPELVQEILSHLSWRQQLTVQRVSQGWQSAVRACLSRRRELHIVCDQFGGPLFRNEWLFKLLRTIPALETLSVVGSTDAAVTHIRVYDSRLDRLSVGIQLGAPEVQQLCASCPRLRDVTLHCSLDDTGLEALLRLLPRLRSLRVEDVAAEGRCLSRLPASLQELSISHCSWTRFVGFLRLEGGAQLRRLDLSRTRVTDDELAAAVSACPRLQRLAVVQCPLLTPGWLSALSGCPQLERLDISGLSGANAGKLLTICRRLQRLALALTGTPFSALPDTSLPELTHLDLSYTDTSDAVLCRLTGLLPGLRDLRLTNCLRLTAAALAQVLPRFSSLQVLDISALRISVTAVLAALDGLSLRALACECGRAEETAALRALDVLRRLPTLAVLRPLEVTADHAPLLVRELAASEELAHRQVTLLLQPSASPRGAKVQLPPNFRVVDRDDSVWRELSGW